jgi:NADH-quinone oxidoreductase subunit N
MNELVIPVLGNQMGELLPYLILACGGLLVMLVDSFVPTLKKGHLSFLTMFIFIGMIAAQKVLGPQEGTVLSGMLAINGFSIFFNYLFAGIGVVTTLYATAIFDRDGKYRPEFYPLVLFSVLGMMILVASNDLITLFLGLETMSLSTYVLVGGVRGNIKSSEAGFKYLLMGGFSSAFLLMGMGMIYGFAGGTSFSAITAAMNGADPAILLVGLGSGLMLIGFGFKVAMVPFHMWTPDVYDGAPAYITGFMATGIKAAGFAIILRFVMLMQPQLAWQWFTVLTYLAVITMTAGNLIALVQSNMKRMLAYSSIAHAGYLMLGVLAMMSPPKGGSDAMISALGNGLGADAAASVLFYLIGYSLMNLAAFGLINMLNKKAGDDADEISRFAGLGRRQPIAAATMAVIMLSLAGIPPMVGFMSKFYLFSVVIRAGLIPLAIFGVINSLISVFYYLRVLVVMYMKEGEENSYEGEEWVSVAMSGTLALIVIYMGLLPDSFHRMAESVCRGIF